MLINDTFNVVPLSKQNILYISDHRPLRNPTYWHHWSNESRCESHTINVKFVNSYILAFQCLDMVKHVYCKIWICFTLVDVQVRWDCFRYELQMTSLWTLEYEVHDGNRCNWTWNFCETLNVYVNVILHISLEIEK